ncbi:MAG: hypothetical protein R3F35_05390 [Myxococcota bacterium]
MSRSTAPKRTLTRSRHRLAPCLTVAIACLLAAPLANAQDWGDSEDDWSASPAPAPASTTTSRSSSYGRSAAAGWSLQAGVGFTADPDTFLMNFEAPYSFNPWISAGPAMQVGVEDHHTIVAPSGNVRITIPDLPGRSLDRLHPYAFTGIGFAYIEKDRGRNDGDGVGLLIPFGVGVEYQVSEKVFLGSQMMFNFLPKETKNEGFFFSWQMAGLRFAF